MVKLKVAIQKSGRLNEDTLELLKECGICINNGKDQLMAQASNFPIGGVVFTKFGYSSLRGGWNC